MSAAEIMAILGCSRTEAESALEMAGGNVEVHHFTLPCTDTDMQTFPFRRALLPGLFCGVVDPTPTRHPRTHRGPRHWLYIHSSATFYRAHHTRQRRPK